MLNTFIVQKLWGFFLYFKYSQNCLSWGKFVKQLKTISNLDTLDLSHVQSSKEMSTYYSGKLMNQLIHIRNSETGKLRFFSKILTTFHLCRFIKFPIKQCKEFISHWIIYGTLMMFIFNLIFTCFTEFLISWYFGFAIPASFNSKAVCA
jgi:hypothetical protein